MTFVQAKRKLKKIANGEYHSMGFELTTYSEPCGGNLKSECTLYINGVSTHCKGATWEEAFEKLALTMNPPPPIEPPTEDELLKLAPRGDV